MTGKDINNWIMYHEIHQLARLGFKKAKIARYLVVDARTVGKYLAMSEQDYQRFLTSGTRRNKKLSEYEGFVRDRLIDYPDTSAAQMHDWLKEHHPGFPDVTGRTVYNFVMFVRAEHNIPVVGPQRDYFPVEELPYGRQGQVMPFAFKPKHFDFFLDEWIRLVEIDPEKTVDLFLMALKERVPYLEKEKMIEFVDHLLESGLKEKAEEISNILFENGIVFVTEHLESKK